MLYGYEVEVIWKKHAINDNITRNVKIVNKIGLKFFFFWLVFFTDFDSDINSSDENDFLSTNSISDILFII